MAEIFTAAARALAGRASQAVNHCLTTLAIPAPFLLPANGPMDMQVLMNLHNGAIELHTGGPGSDLCEWQHCDFTGIRRQRPKTHMRTV